MFQLMVLNPGMTPAQAERAYRRLYDDTRRRMGGAFDWPTLKLSIPGRAERLRELWQLAYGHGHAGFPEQRNPGRPPKGWWRSCTAGVGPGYDPGRVCGATWARMSPSQRRAAMARHERNPEQLYALDRDGRNMLLGTMTEIAAWIHRHHSYSLDHALKHEGYTVTPVQVSYPGGVTRPGRVHRNPGPAPREANPRHYYKVIAYDPARRRWGVVGQAQNRAQAVEIARGLPGLSSGSGMTYSPYSDIIVKDVGTARGTPFFGEIVFRLTRDFDGQRERWTDSTPHRNPGPVDNTLRGQLARLKARLPEAERGARGAMPRSPAMDYLYQLRAEIRRLERELGLGYRGNPGAAWHRKEAAELKVMAAELEASRLPVASAYMREEAQTHETFGERFMPYTGRELHGERAAQELAAARDAYSESTRAHRLGQYRVHRHSELESKKNPEEADADSVRELDLFAENESRLYNQKKSITANLMQKLAKGTYNPTLAPKLWYYWYDAAAKLYAREFGGPVFSTAVRRAAAEARAREEYEKMVGGEYGELPAFKTRGGLTRQHYLGGRAANPYAVKYTDMGGRERGAFFRDRRAFERWQDRTLGKSVKGFTLTGRVEPREISRRMKGNPACPAKAGFRAFHDADPDRAWKVKVPDSFPARLYMIGKLHKLVLDTGAQLTGGVLAAGSGNRLYVIGARGAGPAAARAVQVEYIPPKVSRKAGAVYFHKFTRPPQVRRVGSGGHYTVAGRGVRLTPRGIVG